MRKRRRKLLTEEAEVQSSQASDAGRSASNCYYYCCIRDQSSLKAVARIVGDAATWLNDQEFGEEAESEGSEEKENKSEEKASEHAPHSLAEIIWNLDNCWSDANF